MEATIQNRVKEGGSFGWADVGSQVTAGQRRRRSVETARSPVEVDTGRGSGEWKWMGRRSEYEYVGFSSGGLGSYCLLRDLPVLKPTNSVRVWQTNLHYYY
jgi:hypothetical protein